MKSIKTEFEAMLYMYSNVTKVFPELRKLLQSVSLIWTSLTYSIAFDLSTYHFFANVTLWLKRLLTPKVAK